MTVAAYQSFGHESGTPGLQRMQRCICEKLESEETSSRLGIMPVSAASNVEIGLAVCISARLLRICEIPVSLSECCYPTIAGAARWNICFDRQHSCAGSTEVARSARLATIKSISTSEGSRRQLHLEVTLTPATVPAARNLHHYGKSTRSRLG